MKRESAIPLILSVALALCLVGCGNDAPPEEEAEPEATQQPNAEYERIKTNDFNNGASEYYIKNLWFSVPSSWRMDNEKNPGTTYFYPPSGNGLELLMVVFSESEESILKQESVDGLISGLEEGYENYKYTSSAFDKNLIGENYAIIKYSSTVKGNDYNFSMVCFDCDGGFVYFLLGELSDSSYDYSSDFKNIVDSVAISSAPEQTESESEGEAPTATIGELNALEKALSYLNYTSFSRSGLIDQLEYEGFSTEEATYGVDNCGADWNEQAAKKAQSYLDYSSFSRQGLIDQLVFEGFTQEQAEYGVSAVGY